MTQLLRFDAADLALWTWSGLTEAVDDGPEIRGRPRYNGGAHLVGTLRSPIVETEPFDEAVASWTARTPGGTWIETRVRVAFGKRWTRWYSLGVWAEAATPVARHSVPDQKDDDAEIATDVLRLSARARAAQVEMALFTLSADTLPLLTSVSLSLSGADAPHRGFRADRAAWGRTLEVPPRSQMVHPGGGDVWCSPTAVSMVLAYHGVDVPVPDAASDTYDWAYDGCGNWPFNTAYAGRFGYDAYVTRLGSLQEIERLVRDGVPVVASYAWRDGELDGAPLPAVEGHLGVVVGFDGSGDPVLNDPAAPSDAEVRRTYPRWQFERQWLRTSRGTVYVIRPR